MEREQQNRLNMIGACLNLVQSPEHRPTWENKDPLDFTADVAALATLYAAARDTAQKIQTPTTGVTQSKADAETVLEERAFLLSAALRNHFKKTDDAENYAKVNYSKSAIQSLRHQDLVTTTRIIRDCGTAALTHADAGKRGITTAKVTALTEAIDAFDALLAAPRHKINDRSAYVRELVTQLAACLTQMEDMDDLVLQFAGTADGDRFIVAWKQARIIVDAGGGPGEEEPPTPTPPTP